MELKIDLIPKRQRSKFTLVIGIVSILIPIIYLVFRILGDSEKLFSQLPMMILLTLQGITGIISGMGYSVEKIFGSAFVLVDNEQIAIKMGVWTKVKSIEWSQVRSMEYKTNWFEIIHTDGSISKLVLSELEFKVLVETRDAISFIAAEKGITSH